jgi:spore maturation protein CgeB
MEGIRFSGGVYASPDDRAYKLKAGTLERLRTKVLEDAPASEADREKKESPEVYYREIAASRIAVALRGGGRTASLRYFEVVAMGAMLLSDQPETLIPNDFVDRRHAVYCKPDLSDLEALVRYYLREETEREAIVAEGRAHVLKYHTCERRAEYFLDVCARHL